MILYIILKMYICTWGDAQTLHNTLLSPSPLPYTHTHAHAQPVHYRVHMPGDGKYEWHIIRVVWVFLFPFFAHTHIFICHRSAWQSTMSAGEREKQSWNRREWDRQKSRMKKFCVELLSVRARVCASLSSNWCIANSTSSINLIECLF